MALEDSHKLTETQLQQEFLDLQDAGKTREEFLKGKKCMEEWETI